MPIQDKKHWSSKSEASRDEVRDAVEEAVDWLIVRRREAGMAAGAAAILALAGGVLLYSHRARQRAAWDKLAQAELLAYSGRPADAEGLLDQVAQDGGSASAAVMARLLQGDMHYPRGEYDQSLAAYDKAAAQAPDVLKPYALADKVMALEAAGKAAECVAAAQSFLDANGDHLLAAQINASLARCQLALGQTEAGRATLQKIVVQFPQTPWADWANFRLQPPASPSK